MIDLSNEIMTILENYNSDVTKVVTQAVDKVSEKGVEKLKAKSPKRRGKYAGSWTVKERVNSLRKKINVIHNAKHYRLTHLLEFGHATVNGGFVSAQPHIAEVEQELIKDFEKEIRKGIEES